MYTQDMRRFFIIVLFVFYILLQTSRSYAIPTSLPPGAIQSVDGILIPGLTCGIANDPDPSKLKCCVPKKKDDNIFINIQNWTNGWPIIGELLPHYTESYKAIDGLSSSMKPCSDGAPSTNDLYDKSCICIKGATSSAILELNSFCKKYFPLLGTANATSELQKCTQCIVQTGGFYTAIGCIPLDVGSFISNYVLGTGIGIAGGIAFLCILYSAFRMQTSMGNAEALKKAQENLTACITGLIVIIFSVLILKIIGVDILRIPGLFKP